MDGEIKDDFDTGYTLPNDRYFAFQVANFF